MLKDPGISYSFVVPSSQLSERLDKALSQWGKEYHLSRTRLQALIQEGHVQVNGACQRDPAVFVKGGDSLEISIPPLDDPVPVAQPIPLSIVYEDDHLLVLDKQAGLVVHPGAGHGDQTLVNGLLFHCGESLSGISGVRRPGIVHRLDKGTSGLMVVAKNDPAHQGLAQQFEGRRLSRVYNAVVWGWPSPGEGTLQGAIGRHPQHRQKMALVGEGRGKPAITHYEVLERFSQEGVKASLVQCRLETGRTHQIRVHLSQEGHGLVGDPLYGKVPRGLPLSMRAWLQENGWKEDRQALHAVQLSFYHPLTQELMTFHSSFPEDISRLICYLKKGMGLN